MNNIKLEKLINKKLNNNTLQDYAPNGLQVEGRNEVKHIIVGVTACQILLNNALKYDADAIIVHHGFFWKNETLFINGIKRNRLKTLLINNINLYAWHLPLDIHPELGNNIQFALSLGINVIGKLNPLVLYGEFLIPFSGKDLHFYLKKKLRCSNILYCGDNGPLKIRRLAWCTGSGQDFINLAVEYNMDAFITGEVSEKTIHIAREGCLHFYSVGHHTTEKGGIQALGKWLSDNYSFDVTFIDVFNPV